MFEKCHKFEKFLTKLQFFKPMAKLYVTVRDKKRNITRQITRLAYQSMPGRYELIDDSNAPVKALNTQAPQKKSEKVAAPVVSEPQTLSEVTVTIGQPKKRGRKPKTQEGNEQ